MAIRIRGVDLVGLEDGEADLGGVAGEVELAGYAGGVVRRVGFAVAGGEGLLHGFAGGESVAEGAGLVAVGDEELAGQLEHRFVDDEAGVFDLGGIEGLGAERSAFERELPVAGVGRAAHDPVDLLPSVAGGGFADDESAARIGVGGDVGLQGGGCGFGCAHSRSWRDRLGVARGNFFSGSLEGETANFR